MPQSQSTADVIITPQQGKGVGMRLIGASVLIGQLEELENGLEGEVEYAVGTPLDYGAYQELGSAANPPQPYLRPAAESVGRNAGSILSRHPNSISNGVREIANEVKDEAESNAPVDTGRLRDSLRVTKVK